MMMMMIRLIKSTVVGVLRSFDELMLAGASHMQITPSLCPSHEDQHRGVINGKMVQAVAQGLSGKELALVEEEYSIARAFHTID